MLVIGLTGGIASGKSTVSQMLRQLGAEVIDSDLVARQVIEPESPAWRELVEEFGRFILNRDGTINRRRLGGLVFGHPGRLRRLNQITHPRILARVRGLVEEARRRDGDRVLVIDAPLLIEVGMQSLVDQVWVVMVDPETQVKRLMARDRFTFQEALNRLSAQLPLEEKARQAHAVIDNRGGVEETRAQILRLWQAIRPLAGGGPKGQPEGGGGGGGGAEG
ncbi:MAG: dephospho-CoA kinase [Acetobacteraceae bacterium]|nr:dephospho-CoA kinase [Acetobacteraceae bacterium]